MIYTLEYILSLHDLEFFSSHNSKQILNFNKMENGKKVLSFLIFKFSSKILYCSALFCFDFCTSIWLDTFPDQGPP